MTDLSSLADLVETLTRESALLNASLFKAKSLPTADQVTAEILSRTRFRTRIKELDGKLAAEAATLRKMVADVQSLRSILEIADDTQKTDSAELDALKWELIHLEKEARTEATRPVRTIPVQPRTEPLFSPSPK